MKCFVARHFLLLLQSLCIFFIYFFFFARHFDLIGEIKCDKMHVRNVDQKITEWEVFVIATLASTIICNAFERQRLTNSHNYCYRKRMVFLLICLLFLKSNFYNAVLTDCSSLSMKHYVKHSVKYYNCLQRRSDPEIKIISQH